MFEEGTQIDHWSSYEDLVAQILADGKVSHAETEQAINALGQCLNETGLSGTLTYNLDTYPWSEQDLYVPESIVPTLSDEDFNDPAKRESYETKNAGQYEERMARCNVFNPVREWVLSHADFASYEKARYDARVECIRTNAPSYADRISDSWPRGAEGLQRLSETFTPIITTDSDSSEDLKGLTACMTSAGEKVITIGPEGQ
ncbi:hypothetical protein [Bifidobacterium avesanii]|uniref:Uncharacterized protein n=1 Tax=Bifidobacterium avesanii TaxID=1798157 RepID=A0A7K3TIB4_9BIFI|nr:hypothetical protein [Bifidobacterium avesanii]NEG78636.1 hypothetical protein [Bifidobacterium avesanii]